MNCLLGETKSATNSAPATSSSAAHSIATTTTTNSTNQQQATSNNNKIINNCNNIGHTLNSQETCLICGDIASGKHYGLRSCEACKAFFKRTVQGKIEYSCPATRECEINKRRRKACQACRFQKCLNMGMLKEGVRLDRVRGGRQKYRRGLSPGGGGGGIGAGGSGGGGVAGSGIGCNGANLGAGNAPGSASLVSGSSGHQSSTLNLVGSSNMTSETNRIMTALINCEPEELSASPGQFVTNIPSTLSAQMKTLYILSDLFDRELVSLIGWAKQIPGFSETITLNDQMRLLQSTWAEVIALSIGYRSHLKRMESIRQQQQQQQQHGSSSSSSHFMNATPSPTSSSPTSTASSYYHNNSNNNNGNNQSSCNIENTEIRLVFAKDLILDHKHAGACGAEEIFYSCAQLIKRLDHLKITPNEYIILKAISLTNADVRLENPKATHQLRDLIMDTLYEASLSERSDTSNICEHNDDTSNLQLKSEPQERPLSSMNQYASASPARPSSSVPSSSSLTSISSHNNSINATGFIDVNNNNNAITNNADSTNNRKAIINHRLNQLLLCLPVLRQIDSCIRKFWNDVRKGPNSVPMNKLFEEMLEPCQRIYKSSAGM